MSLNNINTNNIIFANIVLNLAKLSKCVSFKVAAIVVKNNRIISSGINGTISGFINCNEKFPNYNKEFDRAEHSAWSNLFEIHAEMNALFFALKNNIDINNSILYCTHMPCFICFKHILLSGIKTIYYVYPYDKSMITEDIIIDYKKAGLLDNLIQIPETTIKDLK